MSSRNVLKIDLPDSYYHVYARGISKQAIFLEPKDYQYFLDLLRRYLTHEEVKNSIGMPYDKLHESLQLLAFCLMQNHFHLLLYQITEGGMSRLMRGVMTAYSRYFNLKYGRRGPLFETRYKASRITTQAYLDHITRYIHLNPDDWRNYTYSSLSAYKKGSTGHNDWFNVSIILEMFDSPAAYMAFVEEYKDVRDELKMIEHELADH